MRLRPILQPFGDHTSSYETLSELLGRTDLTHLTVAVAWARVSGLSRLQSGLAEFHTNGGVSEIILGIDEGGASVEGLALASKLFDRARVLYDRRSGTFHPKLWLFTGDGIASILVGSNNLTAGGLYFNYEAAILVHLDLSVRDDVALYGGFAEYLDRLRTDSTGRELDEGLIDELRDGAGFSLKDELRHRLDRARRNWKAEAGADSTATEALFGSSRHAKKADPHPRVTAGKTAEADDYAPSLGGTPLIGGSNAPVIAEWSKKLTKSDCGRPNPGSNTTNALRFTKAGHDIDHATWFREVLFEDADWVPDPAREGREHALVRFDVVINGVSRGTHELEIKYDHRRGAGQSNFTTDLKWGSLTPALRENDLVNEFVYINKHEDGALSMVIEKPHDLRRG